MSKSDYKKPRTNLFELLPEVYRSGVNESVLETTLNRFLAKTELQRKIGFVGQGNPNAIIDRQIQEPDPHRQAFQLQPLIYSQVGTVEHISSSKDILSELERLGVDIDRMKEWGDAVSFNWAPPIDYDKLLNFRDYYWENLDNIADQPQYVTILNPCTKAEAKLSEYEITKSQFGSEFNIVGLDAAAREIIIEGDQTLLFTEGFLFYVRGSTNPTINNEFFTTVSSRQVPNLERTAITIASTASPAFDDSIVDGVVSLDELEQIFQSEVDCACNGSLGWDGGLWDDSQIGDIIWNAELIQGNDVFAPGNIQFSSEANWITNNGTVGSPPVPAQFSLWHDTASDELKQYNAGWIVVQSEFSVILNATTGGQLWDQTQECDIDFNTWQEQNKWIHKNQVSNFTLAKQAQIPIIEFLDTVQLNEWAETTYLWKYRAVPATDDFAETTVTPTVLELMGITNPASPAKGSPAGSGYVIDPSLNEVVINSQYGDMTSIFVPGFVFRITDDTLTLANNDVYTVEWSTYCEETAGAKLQTRVRIVEMFTATSSDGTIIPDRTSVGDRFQDLHTHWVFAGIGESKPTVHQSANPMLEIPIDPPPPPIDFLTTSLTPLGTYVLSLYAQSLSIYTDCFDSLNVVGVTPGSPSSWTLTGNHADTFNDPKFGIIGSILEVSGDTGGGANGQYTITNTTDVGSNTVVDVAEVIPASAAGDGTAFVHWTFTFDDTLHNQTRINTNELRVYLNDVRQYGTYSEINTMPASSPPIETCDDYVNSIVLRTPMGQFDTIRVEVGAAAASDVGLENVIIRTNEDDLTFNLVTGLSCVSLVRYRKLEQVKTETNQYPLFDLFDVNGDPINRADRVFEFQESQDQPIDPYIGRRIVRSSDRRTYFYEQSLLDEDDGPIFTYRDTCICRAFGFWFDTDTNILYRWDGDNWNPKIDTSEFASSTGSPAATVCYLAPIVGEDPPGSPWIDIDGMMWYNTNNNTINISNGTTWTLDTFRTAGTAIAPADPTLQSIWRTGPITNKTYYVPEYVDEDRTPILYHTIIGVDVGTQTWIIYDDLESEDRFGNPVTLLQVGDTIQINDNLDLNSNTTYTVDSISVNETNRTAAVTVVEAIPGTATISGHMTRPGDPAADWEVPDQLYFNSAHENRKILSSTDLLAHFLSIVESQEVPPGLFGTSASLFHALTDINFGLGGTIKEHNDSYDTFLSSIFVQTVNPISLYEFAHDAYESSLNQIKESYRRDVNTLMTNTSEEAVADPSTFIANSLITEYETNDFANFVYGDSNTYIQETNTGVRNWPATLPFTRLARKVQPVLLDDPTIGLNAIRHHDGHISQVGFLSTSLNQFALRIILTDDARATNPSGKMGTQSTTLPPEDFSAYEAVFGKTSACYWYQITTQGRTLYRMTAVRVSASSAPPSVSLPIGTYWYDITNDRLKVLQDGSPGGPTWVNATIAAGKLTEGSVSAWEVVDINQLLAETVLEVETRLYDAAPLLAELAFDIDTLTTLSPDIAARYERDTFFEFINQVDIEDPFDNSARFDTLDPFTWNFKQATTPAGSVYPQIGQTVLDTAGTWQDLYQKAYGTPYPHIEPWKLQGYPSKPDWWDGAYADTSGTRRWSSTMWATYILPGRVPAGELLPNGQVSTGVLGEVQRYNYVSVNITSTPETGLDNVTYAPDALLPPLVTFIPPPAGVRSFFDDPSQVPGKENNYQYDDAGLIEWTWENSSQFLYDQLKVAFRMQPVRFIQQTLGETFLEVGCLEVSRDLEKVYSHQDARFHGDLLDDNTVLQLPGTLQWYVNFNRFNGYDSSSSNFRPMWTGWRTFLAYQFATFVDTESFIVFNRNFDITTQDFEVRIKRSPGIEDHWVEAFNLTLVQAPPSSLRIDTESQWLFRARTSNPIGRVVNYYATQSYNCSVDTSISPTAVLDTFTVNDIYGRDLPWEDGDAVIIKSTEFLPSPLLPDTQYFVNVLSPTSFSLSEQPNGPVIDLLSTGSGTLTVANVARSFTALDGEATNDKIWYAYELDKDLVLELASPTQLVGIENAINVVLGYAAYEEDVENFRFNHEATDIDPDTSRVVNWQLEVERFIDWAFQARTAIQSRVNFYQWEIGTSSPVTLNFITTTETNASGDVVERTQAPRWTTATKVNVFTEPGGVLPDPLLNNTAYYLIRLNETEFQLALTAKNARNGIGITLTSSGSGDLYVQELQDRGTLPTFELNPFRNNVWINTPQGIVADLFKGPFADVRTDELLFDQFGRRLPSSGVLPLRQDLQTQIVIQEGIVNDLQLDFNNPPNPYNFLHCAAAHVFIDGYEHVVLFNNYAAGGSLIYDPFIGLNTPKFDVQFDRTPEFTLRPNLGGYVLLNQQDIDFTTSLVRNMEGQTEDLRFAYDTYRALEVNDLVEASRDSLGYDGPFEFLSAININPKSQFLFWRGLIQAKGSVNSIKAFVNSRRFVDAKVDEFWAFRLANFGDDSELSLPEVNLFADDTRTGEIRFHFVEQFGTADNGFIEVLPNDQNRWYEFPNQGEFLTTNGNMYFNVGIDFIDITAADYIGTGPHYIELPKPADGVVVLHTGAGSPTITYTQINSQTLEFTGLGSPLPPLRIYLITPYESRHNPCKIRDIVEETTVAQAILWDPARNNHYHNAIHLVDLQRVDDPAALPGYEFDIDPSTGGFLRREGSPFDPWGSIEKDTTWLDTNELGFIPYSDTVIFPDILDRLKQWGRLADWASYKLYQWTESSVPPTQYDALADEQEGDFAIDPQIRVTGNVRKVTYKNDGGSPTNWVEFPFEKYEVGSRKYADLTSIPFDISVSEPATLYKDGKLVGTFSATDLIVVGINTGSPATPTPALEGSPPPDYWVVEGSVEGLISVGDQIIIYNNTGTGDGTYTVTEIVDETVQGSPAIIFPPVGSPVGSPVIGGSPITVQPTPTGNTILVVAENIPAGATADGNIGPNTIQYELTTTFVDTDFVTIVKYQPTQTQIDEGTTYRELTPFTREFTVVNGEPVARYYFWVENKNVRQTWRKKELSMVEATQQLETIPVPYVVPQKLEAPVFGGTPSEEIRPRRYVQAILRNYGTLINADDRYVLRFTRNFILRDDLDDTTQCHTTLKTLHQEWELFRKEQPFNIPRYLWDLVTESVIGQTLASLDSVAVRVPSLDRELYDVERGTSTRIGIAQAGQAFCDGESAWDAILQYLQDGSNNFAPIDIQDYFDRNDILNLVPRNPTDAQAIADAMDELYNTFTFENVNRIYFSVLETAAMPFQLKYEDMFKTSWVALHGIRILETDGIFDD